MRPLASLFPASAVLAALWSIAPSSAAEPLTLMLGDETGGQAELVFNSEMTGADAFTLKTTRVGAPGSVITLGIDRSSVPLVTHTFSADDCSFATGESICTIEITGGSKGYRDLVAAFKAGLTAHLTVTNAGQMAMQSDASLKGFTAAFDKL